MKKGFNYIDRTCYLLKSGGYQRTLHYHNTPAFYGSLYEEQLKYVADHYVSCNLDYLDRKLLPDTFEREFKKSMVIGLFDGYRNNYEVMYPLLEKYGLTAWYLLVSDFLNTPVDRQEKMLEPYHMQYVIGEYKDGRYAMSWEEAKEAGKTHVIVNHTATHYFMKPDTDEKRVCYEIDHAHRLIEEKTGVCPEVFSALGGADYHMNHMISRKLREKGYRYMFGYSLEHIGETEGTYIPEDTDDEHTDVMDDVQIREEIRYHQMVMDQIGKYSAIPAILPFYTVDTSVKTTGTEEDRQLAEHFKNIAFFLQDKLSFDEWNATHRALDILAFLLIGKDFPYH
ncbi:polysaccharide deacetylase family protein [Robinsoniella peoriensis]